jgi:hypothetical protein
MLERRTAPLERRLARRIPFVAAVKHKVGRDVQLALSLDLGPDGLRLKRPAGVTYLPRTPVSLTFALPDGGELVRARGVMVFERAQGGYAQCGVRFTELSPLDHERILRVLRIL